MFAYLHEEGRHSFKRVVVSGHGMDSEDSGYEGRD